MTWHEESLQTAGKKGSTGLKLHNMNCSFYHHFKINALTIVRKIPNSGLISTLSPSVKTKFLRRSFLQVRTIAICWAATDNTGRSMRLNSSKQPHDPDWARPGNQTHVISLSCKLHVILELKEPIPKIWNHVSVSLQQHNMSRWFLPLKILPRPLKSIWSEQLKTTTYFPRQRPMSFIVSVLPYKMAHKVLVINADNKPRHKKIQQKHLF